MPIMLAMEATVKQPANERRNRGRPREFDLHDALDKAVRVFSERGYHGTSITDLTQAMGLSQGSIYKAFGDKRGVFLAAFQHYRAERSQQLKNAIGLAGTGRERLVRALGFYVESSQGTQGRQGCLVVGSAAELATFEPDVARHITHALDRNEALLGELTREGQADGSINPRTDPNALARMLLCLAQGMRVVGKTGRTAADMQAVVDTAIKALD